MSDNEGPRKLSLSDLADHQNSGIPELSHQHRLLLDGFNKIYDLFRSGNLRIQSSNVVSFQAFAEITRGLEAGTPETQLMLNGMSALGFLAAMHQYTTDPRHKALLEIVFDDLQRALKELRIDTCSVKIFKHGDLVRSKVGDLLKLKTD